MPPLNPGDPFPKLTINVPGGQRLIIPDDFAGDFATVLFYRGSWCPYCNAQLRAFQRSGQALADAGVRERIRGITYVPEGGTADEFRARIDGDIQTFTDVVKAANLKFEQ